MGKIKSLILLALLVLSVSGCTVEDKPESYISSIPSILTNFKFSGYRKLANGDSVVTVLSTTYALAGNILYSGYIYCSRSNAIITPSMISGDMIFIKRSTCTGAISEFDKK
jgi:hypothetical protein